ncbi:hypothetical protein [Lachnotalea sp. AF33-28]|uniref:hypothetical protein n=1 Tax=Lachnotalea sp. AF33-28 TaxID=2292046 RepID=UPI000E47C241|nr:hypothetical protein [Lachnotalea sp. AF33-28]RHP31468.1 hypothetical protein DWZ56_16150 [Lachnotalea sp. AF33-28]
MAMLIFFLPYLVFRPLLKNRNYDLISASCIEYNGSSYSFTAPGELDELKEKYFDVYIHGIRWCTAVKEWRYRMTVNYTGKNGEMISDAFYIDDNGYVYADSLCFRTMKYLDVQYLKDKLSGAEEK